MILLISTMMALCIAAATGYAPKVSVDAGEGYNKDDLEGIFAFDAVDQHEYTITFTQKETYPVTKILRNNEQVFSGSTYSKSFTISDIDSLSRNSDVWRVYIVTLFLLLCESRDY